MSKCLQNVDNMYFYDNNALDAGNLKSKVHIIREEKFLPKTGGNRNEFTS